MISVLPPHLSTQANLSLFPQLCCYALLSSSQEQQAINWVTYSGHKEAKTHNNCSMYFLSLPIGAVLRKEVYSAKNTSLLISLYVLYHDFLFSYLYVLCLKCHLWWLILDFNLTRLQKYKKKEIYSAFLLHAESKCICDIIHLSFQTQQKWNHCFSWHSAVLWQSCFFLSLIQYKVTVTHLSLPQAWGVLDKNTKDFH